MTKCLKSYMVDIVISPTLRFSTKSIPPDDLFELITRVLNSLNYGISDSIKTSTCL